MRNRRILLYFFQKLKLNYSTKNYASSVGA